MSRHSAHRLGRTASGVVSICALFATVAAAQDTDVKPVTVQDSRDMRFCEILMVKATGVDVYNTTGVSDCPENLWSAMDLKAVAAEFGAEKVEQNGPHFWMPDSQTFDAGEEVTVGGIKARFVARLDPAIMKTASTGIAPYTVFTPKKTQKMTYAKGKPVYEIVDPDGHVYVLQAHEAQFPIDTLDKLGDKLNLPEGWQFRTRTLTDDLVLDLGPSQTIYAIGDVFHQYWTRVPSSN